MKLFKQVLCLIFVLILLAGCNNNSNNEFSNNNSFDEGGGGCEPIIHTLQKQYKYSKNVYIAELLSYEDTGERYYANWPENQQGDVRVVVNIKFVFKGNFVTGEEAVVDYLRSVYVLPVNGGNNDHTDPCLKVGSEYLFMSGWEDGYKDEIEGSSLTYNFIERVGENDYIQHTLCYCGHYYYQTFDDLIYDMLNLEHVFDSFRQCNYDIYPSLPTYEKVYESADNIYIGNIVEIEDGGKHKISLDSFSEEVKSCVLTKHAGDVEFKTSKIRVKVLSVIKGDYKPGEIIEDVVIIKPEAVESLYGVEDPAFLFTGDFFEGYNEMFAK